MIKINLLKQVSRKQGKGSFSSLMRTGIAVFAGLVVVVAGAGMMRWWLNHPRPEQEAAVVKAETEKKAVPETAAVVQKAETEKKAVPETAAVVQKAVPEKKAVPEAAAVAQQVTPGTPSAGAHGTPKVPGEAAIFSYSGLPRVEKTNYEIAFAKKILQTLTDAVPEGIGFNSLSIDSFMTVSADGLGSTREDVSTFFSNLRRLKGFQLLEFPVSSIRQGPSQDFQFQFKCRVWFDADSAGTYRPTEHLLPSKNLPSMLQTFSKYAAHSGLSVRRGLVRRAAVQSGGYRQFVYRLSCCGTYRDFVKFVLQVNKAHMPCAFTALQISARSEAVVDIGADVVFTMRK